MKRNHLLFFIFGLYLLICFHQASCNTNKKTYVQKITGKSSFENRYEFVFRDESGKLLFIKNLRRFYGFNEGYATVILMDWDYAILDEKGNVSQTHFKELGQKFSEGKNYARFLDGSMGFIDVNGNTLFKMKIGTIDGYMAATTFCNGRAFVKQSESIWIMIDETGKKLNEYKMRNARDFSCGFSLVTVNDNGSIKDNFIDSNGNYISPVNFDDADDFFENSARVRLGDEIFFIDTKGNRIAK